MQKPFSLYPVFENHKHYRCLALLCNQPVNQAIASLFIRRWQSAISCSLLYYKSTFNKTGIALLTSKKTPLQNAKVFWICCIIYRAPVFDNCDPNGSSELQLRVGTPSAQERNCLWLLPSGPDQVHRSSLRRTHPSTLSSDTCLTSTIPMTGIQSRYSGLRVTGHRYLPI